MKGNLNVGDPRTWWREHVAELYTLPPLHKDPFDRILIAQAMAKELTLVTTDGEMPRYASARLQVVS